MLKKLICVIVTGTLTACAADKTLHQKAKDQAAAYVDRYKEESASTSTVVESDRPYVKAVAVEHRPAMRGGVSLKVTSAPLQSLLQTVAEQNGYDLAFIGKVDVSKKVTVSLTNQPFERAVKDMAFAAGYVAVVDHRYRKVSIAEEATYTFRIDPQSVEQRTDEYSTTSSPGAGGGGSSSNDGSGSGGSSGGTPPLATSSQVKLGAPNTGGSEDFVGVINNMVGAVRGSNQVQYVKSTGMLTVRGNAAELRRVTDFVENFVRDSMIQVELEAAIVEVNLVDEFQYGIDWARVVPLSGVLSSGQASVSVSNRGLVSNPSVTANITTNSVTSVIRALRERTNVNIVAEPRVTSLNHREGLYLRTVQRPYLPEVQQTSVPNAGVTVSGKVAYVPDGISFSFKPAVMTNNFVRARIMPVISTAENTVNFQLGGATATAYIVPLSQSHLEVALEAGKTTIVGGLGLDRGSNLDSSVPGVGDIPLLGSLLTTKTRNGQKTQTVMLLTARIIPAPSNLNPIVAESL